MKNAKNIVSLFLATFTLMPYAYATHEPSRKGPLTCFEQVKVKSTVKGSFKLNITQLIMEAACEKDLRESTRYEVDACENKVRKMLVVSDELVKKLTKQIPELKPHFARAGNKADALLDFLFSRSVFPVAIDSSEEGTYGSEDSYIEFNDIFSKLGLSNVTDKPEYIDRKQNRPEEMDRLWYVGDKVYFQNMTYGLGFKHLLASAQAKAFEAVSADLHSIYLSQYMGESTVVIPTPSTYTINDAIFNGDLPRFQIFVDTSKGSPMLYLNQWIVNKSSVTLAGQNSYPLNQRNEATYEADILKGRGHISAVYSFGCKPAQ